MTWQKGQSGNPLGKPKRLPLPSEKELRSLWSTWAISKSDDINKIYNRFSEKDKASFYLAIMKIITPLKSQMEIDAPEESYENLNFSRLSLVQFSTYKLLTEKATNVNGEIDPSKLNTEEIKKYLELLELCDPGYVPAATYKLPEITYTPSDSDPF